MTREQQAERSILTMLERFRNGAAYWQVLGSNEQTIKTRRAALESLKRRGLVEEYLNGRTTMVRRTSGGAKPAGGAASNGGR